MSFLGQNSPLAGKRVLVIEDTIENLRLFRAILQLEDAQVLEASQARVGIEIAQRELPDVILMDMQMPELDGLSATRLLRSDALTRHIPIIMITASAMHEDRQRALDAGCSGYITKPVEPMNFGRQIAGFMDNSN